MAQKAFNVPAAYADWREMLEHAKLDAVVVSTPHHVHTVPTLAALKRGLHVLVEKPMALTSQDAWAMVEAAERAGRVLMVGYGNRFRGLWQAVKSVLTEGGLGRLRQINLATCSYRRWFWDAGGLPDDARELLKKFTDVPEQFFSDWGHTWHSNPEQMGGGAFADVGTHLVDLVLWLAGAPPVEVVAFTEAAGLPVECFVNVQARLANGVLFSMTSADAVPQELLGGERHLMIVGDDGILTDDAEGRIWIYRDGERMKLEPESPNGTEAAGFVSAILDGNPDYPQAVEGAHAVDFMEAMYRSAAEGRIIKVEEMKTREAEWQDS